MPMHLWIVRPDFHLNWSVSNAHSRRLVAGGQTGELPSSASRTENAFDSAVAGSPREPDGRWIANWEKSIIVRRFTAAQRQPRTCRRDQTQSIRFQRLVCKPCLRPAMKHAWCNNFMTDRKMQSFWIETTCYLDCWVMLCDFTNESAFPASLSRTLPSGTIYYWHRSHTQTGLRVLHLC